MSLREALRRRYPRDLPADKPVFQTVLEVCQWFIDNGLGDPDTPQRLASDNDHIYWQALSEVMVADQLHRCGLAPARQPDSPDVQVVHQGRHVWVEVVCPTPAGIPDQWLRHEEGAVTFPHEAVSLRWTSALKEKFEKLVGMPGRNYQGYIAKGIVRPEDAYVIAINGRLLRDSWPAINGISLWPFAVEVTYAIGPRQLQISRDTGAIMSSSQQHRPSFQKPNGASIPSDSFFNPGYAPVSAVWAMDIDEHDLWKDRDTSILVHNHGASNPLPANLLPAYSEYSATVGSAEYTINRRDGRLAKNGS